MISPYTQREVNFSVSSAEAYEGCKARWFADKILGWTIERNDVLTWGVGLHKVAELYQNGKGIVTPGEYEDGKDKALVTQDHIDRFLPLVSKLPKPGSGTSEGKAPKFVVYSGPEGEMYFKGAIDWWGEAGAWDLPGLDPDLPTVLDYKTKGNLVGKFGVGSAEELAVNRQGNLYVGALNKHRAVATDFNFVHAYVQRKGVRAYRFLPTKIRARDAERASQAQGPIARDMLVTATATSLADVPGNLNYCNAFGRPCPFQGRCIHYRNKGNAGASAFAALAQPEPTTMSLFDKFRSNYTATKADPPAKPSIPETPAEAPTLPAQNVTPTPPQPLASAPDAARQAVTDAGNGIVPRDTAPHGEHQVTPAWMAEIVSKVKGLDEVAMQNLLLDEGLPRSWWPNVRTLRAGVQDPQQARLLLLLPSHQIVSVYGDKKSPALETAKILWRLPPDEFALHAASRPSDVLLHLRRLAIEDNNTSRAEDIARWLLTSGVTTPWDNSDNEYAEILRAAAMWLRARRGEETEAALAEEVNRLLIASEKTKKKAPKTIANVIKILKAGLPDLNLAAAPVAGNDAEDAVVPQEGRAAANPEAVEHNDEEPLALPPKDVMDVVITVLASDNPPMPAKEPVAEAENAYPMIPLNYEEIVASKTIEEAMRRALMPLLPPDVWAAISKLPSRTDLAVDEAAKHVRYAETLSGAFAGIGGLSDATEKRLRKLWDEEWAAAKQTNAALRPSDPFVLYVGCITDGAQNIMSSAWVRDSIAEVATWCANEHPEIPHWSMFSNFSDNGSKRVTAALRRRALNGEMPTGDWYYSPWQSELTNVPLGELILANGGKIVSRYG